MTVFESATGLAKLGYPIVPLHSYIDGCCTCGDKSCRSPGKHPLTANGVKEATTDADTINRWSAETDGLANIGIATGTGLVVVDIDAKSGGLATLEKWMTRHGAFPPTPNVSTGGGGRHYYFALPKGVSVGNKTGIEPGIDIRCTDGYVVAPPSVHFSGQEYKWETPASTAIAEAPGWLLSKLTGPKLGKSQVGNDTASALTVQGDLTNAVGAIEGERNSTLCRLVGIHLARGDSVDSIESLAIAWAKRCEPPMDAEEVVDVVEALSTKHQRATPAIIASDEDVESVPISVTAWPILDTAAYHGIAGDVIRLIEPNTEADPVAILLSLLVCVGNSVGRKVFFPVEGDKHHLNLFACLVGESSRGRKGTSLGRTKELWPEDDHWSRNCTANGLASGEGLKYAVRDPLEVIEPVKEKGKVAGYQKVIKDQGVSDKRLLVIESEFAETLRVAQREGNTLSPVVRQAWDTGTLKTLTKNDPTVATDAHISILGHITKQELNRLLSDTDCSNGFANRFLWTLVRRSKLLPEGGSKVDLTPFRSSLSKAIGSVSGGMVRSQAARELWCQLYPSLTADRPGVWGKVTSRGEAQTLRLSMVYAVLDGSTTIEVEHLNAAYAVWRYAEASARIIFGEGDELPALEKKILQSIKAKPGINRKELYKALGGHVKAEAMVSALERLLQDKLVRTQNVATGGRPSESWWAVEASEAKVVGTLGIKPTQSIPMPTATERVKPEPVAKTANSSLARTDSDAMPLADLLAYVKQAGGKIVRSGLDFVIEGIPADSIVTSATAALKVHADDLGLLLPKADAKALAEARRKAAWQKRYQAAQAEQRAKKEAHLQNEMTAEEFVRELRAVSGSKPDAATLKEAQQLVAAFESAGQAALTQTALQGLGPC